jgi:hypothetical protein
LAVRTGVRLVAKAPPTPQEVVRHRPARCMMCMAIGYISGRGTQGAHAPGLSTGMLGAVYPSVAVLAEVGRVTIAGSRLDLWMGFLWAHLDRDAEESKVRRELGAT